MVAPKRKGPLDAGLPLVYLDHNILDAFLKNKLQPLKKDLTQHFQAVYSNGTLEEIKRSGQKSKDHADAFLDVLANINAAHMSIIVDENLYETDQVRFINGDPHAIYRQYCNSEPSLDAMRESFKQLGFKIAGGRLGETLSDVSQDGIEAFEQLMDYLEKQIEIIEPTMPELAEVLRQKKESYLKEFRVNSRKFDQAMGKYIEDETTWSGIKDFRQHFKLEPHHFNAIKPPNVLEQIWAIFNKSNAVTNHQAGIDEFFMFNRSELFPDMPNMRFHLHQKVLAGYNMLNTIGYYPDKPLHKDRGFERASSDQTHASLAIFCDSLVTADERMAKKAEAIYEYLKVPTKVLYFDTVV